MTFMEKDHLLGWTPRGIRAASPRVPAGDSLDLLKLRVDDHSGLLGRHRRLLPVPVRRVGRKRSLGARVDRMTRRPGDDRQRLRRRRRRHDAVQRVHEVREVGLVSRGVPPRGDHRGAHRGGVAKLKDIVRRINCALTENLSLEVRAFRKVRVLPGTRKTVRVSATHLPDPHMPRNTHNPT